MNPEPEKKVQAQARTLRLDVNNGPCLTNKRRRASLIQPSQKVWVTRLVERDCIFALQRDGFERESRENRFNRFVIAESGYL